MALDLMMSNYGENQPHMTFTTTSAATTPIISSSGGNPMETTSEKLIAHETAAGLQSVENFINFLSTTTATATATDHHQQHRSGPETAEEVQREETNTTKQENNNNNSSTKPAYEFDLNCQAMADDAVTKFKRVISLLSRNRTGHARFRRGPGPSSTAANSSSPSSTPSPPPSFHRFNNTTTTTEPNHVLESSATVTTAPILCPKPIKQIPMSIPVRNYRHQFDFTAAAAAGSNNNSESALINFANCNSPPGTSFVSGSTTLTVGDQSVDRNGKCDIKDGGGGGGGKSVSESFQITNYSSCSTGKRPPLSSASFKIRKCSSSSGGGGLSATTTTTGSGGSGRCGGTSSGRCHCSRKRKLRLKRSVRVPAISTRMADIPPDDYSWRKYGQKPIKGSPHPRGYYKCSTVRGCPARKHVERALDDPAMLIVTYEGEHNHSISNVEATTANLILESS